MNTIRRRMAVPALVVALALTPVLAGCSVQDLVDKASGGHVSVGGSLPKGWPSEVPVIDGKILFGAGGQGDEGKAWVVTIDATADDPLAAAKDSLEKAGFVTADAASGQAGDVGALAMKNANYAVVVAGTKDGVIYTVTPVTR
ncbi:hypothetical protein [Glaciibacter flavus]|uniref:hypothetical protein n=1 Tax=Orlajensenia flava TaxID=2565934 RepID=UPI003B0091A0